MIRLPVLSPDQSAEWDRRADAAGIELATLMETAGRAVAQVICARYPTSLRGGVLIAVGTGNNGGDGWVAARALQRFDVPVWVAPLGGEPSALNASMATLARAEGVREVTPDGPWPGVALAVDAILGTGARGAPRAPAAALLQRLHDLSIPIVAIDGPTGVDLATGVVHGTPRADLSITFGGPRRGHLLARDEIGNLVITDIGHPPPASEWPTLMTDALAAEWLPRFRAAMHKGERGRVVIIGGASGMTGAVRVAARAAFAAGAGLVHAVAPESSVAILAAAEPDLQTLVQSFDETPSPSCLELIDRADAVVIGPGLGRAAGRNRLVLQLIDAARAIVLDADGLTVMQGQTASLRRAIGNRPCVLTPHPGEFRTLFPEQAGHAELDPWAAAAGAADDVGAAVLLKGVPTVIAQPGRPPITVAAGNPGLATGGSGDLLSGLIGTALAQHLDPVPAAALGAQALGRAADLAARRAGVRTMRPTDVIAALADLWRCWERRRTMRPAPMPPVLLELEAPLET